MTGGVCHRGHVWQEACMAGVCIYVAGEMATAMDGMHPTGMHSCCVGKIPKIDDEKPALNK